MRDDGLASLTGRQLIVAAQRKMHIQLCVCDARGTMDGAASQWAFEKCSKKYLARQVFSVALIGAANSQMCVVVREAAALYLGRGSCGNGRAF